MKIAGYTNGTAEPNIKLLGTDPNNADETKNFLLSEVANGLSDYFAFNYGGLFTDTTTQSVASGDRSAVEFGVSAYNSQVTIGNNVSSRPTRITFAVAGDYDISFLANAYRSSSGALKEVAFWLSLNGTDVAGSATVQSLLASSGYNKVSITTKVRVAAGDYIEIFWTQNDTITLATLTSNGSVPYPATPSVSLTVTKSK